MGSNEDQSELNEIENKNQQRKSMRSKSGSLRKSRKLINL